MKHFQILMLAWVACSIGCQSANLMPTGFAQNPFRSLGSKTPKEPISEHVVPRQPKNFSPTEEFAKGEQALQAGNVKQAREHFRLVVRENPNHAGAHHRLAYIADKFGEFASAEIHYLAALRIQPRNADILCDLGYSLLLQERFEDSRRYLEKSLSVNPNHEATLLNLAALVGKQGDRAGALALYRQVVSEEEAQSYVAQLSPLGSDQATGGSEFVGHGNPSRTPSGNNTRSASTGPPADAQSGEIRPETKTLLDKVARARAGQSTPQDKWDLKNLDPREIPPGRINELFAHIDSEYENNRLNSPPISPANHMWDDQSHEESRAHLVEHTQATRPTPPAHTASAVTASAGQRAEIREALPSSRNQPEHWGEQGSHPSSLPGELPLTPRPDIRQAAPSHPHQNAQAGYGADYPAGSHSPGDFGQRPPAYTLPDDSQPASDTGNPAGALPQRNLAPQQQPYPGSQRLNLIEPAANSPGMSAPGGMQPGLPASHGAATGEPNYEQALQQALRMGMNAGPGQLFPLQSGDSGRGVQGLPGSSTPRLPALMPPPGVTPGPLPTQHNFWDPANYPGSHALPGSPDGLSTERNQTGPTPYTSGYREDTRSGGPELYTRQTPGAEYNQPREYQRAPRGESPSPTGDIRQTGTQSQGDRAPGPHGYEFDYRAHEPVPGLNPGGSAPPTRPEPMASGMGGGSSRDQAVNSSGTIRDWPHSPQAAPLHATPSATGENSATPWFHEGTNSTQSAPASGSVARPNPAMHSAGDNSGQNYHSPPPWPHAPQGDANGSSLHTPRPTSPSGVGQLPQVVPGNR